MCTQVPLEYQTVQLAKLMPKTLGVEYCIGTFLLGNLNYHQNFLIGIPHHTGPVSAQSINLFEKISLHIHHIFD